MEANDGDPRVQSNRMETTWTSEHEKKKKQNMTSVGHSVWSEESQSHVKSSLPSWDLTRELAEVKIADIEEPKERRESCNDVAKKPIMNGVAEETTESCDDIASEPVIPREATQIVVEDMVKMSIEAGADRAK